MIPLTTKSLCIMTPQTMKPVLQLDPWKDTKVLDLEGNEFKLNSAWEGNPCVLLLIRRFGCAICQHISVRFISFCQNSSCRSNCVCDCFVDYHGPNLAQAQEARCENDCRGCFISSALASPSERVCWLLSGVFAVQVSYARAFKKRINFPGEVSVISTCLRFHLEYLCASGLFLARRSPIRGHGAHSDEHTRIYQEHLLYQYVSRDERVAP